MRYAAILAHKNEFETSLMCRVLEVSRSGFYAWLRREPSERAREDKRLLTHIRGIHNGSNKTYGSPRVHEELRAREITCSKSRVERLMREDGLVARPKRRFRATTDSKHSYPVAPNLLERRFGVDEVEGTDRVWVGDITYVPTREGWLYLAVLIDLASRMVVGWAMRTTLHADITLDALRMALWRRRPLAGLIHHSDRGVQYACGEYQRALAAQQIRCSMSRKGDCWDNAVAESFFATLEWELIERSDWHTRREAERDIFNYIEVWYNRERRHSTLGYLSPADYEAQLTHSGKAA